MQRYVADMMRKREFFPEGESWTPEQFAGVHRASFVQACADALPKDWRMRMTREEYLRLELTCVADLGNAARINPDWMVAALEKGGLVSRPRD